MRSADSHRSFEWKPRDHQEAEGHGVQRPVDQHTRGLALQTPESSTEDAKLGEMDCICSDLEHASHALWNTRLLLEIGGNQRSDTGTFAI